MHEISLPLQECMLSDTLNFEPLNDFRFWIAQEITGFVAISTVGCQPGKVSVFDSMRTGDIPLSTKEAVASLLCTTKRFISLVFPDVQQQPNHYDCGLFALAYASSVCNNLNPATKTITNIVYDSIFWSVWRMGNSKLFPVNPNHEILKLLSEIHFVCIVCQTGEI